MSTYLFPGQGSQVKGMGKGLFEAFPEYVKEADEILGYSIETLCLEDPDNLLGQTQYTQPALYIVDCLTYLQMVKESGKKADYVAGHSLGEYCALFAAGVFDFATGLWLVKKRGELMAKAKAGGMAAVIGMPAEKIVEVLKENHWDEIDVANYNSMDQITISGPTELILGAKQAFMDGGARMYVPLKVSGAFHSHMMQDAADEFAEYIKDFSFNKPVVPVFSNVTGNLYGDADGKQLLVEQITHSVRWTDTIRRLMGMGEEEYIEAGPGVVLTKLVKNITTNAEPIVEESKPAESQEPAKEDGNQQESQEPAVEEGKQHKNQEPRKECRLGSAEFRERYHTQYAYVTGGMYKGVASPRMVVAAAKAGMLSFLGTGGLSLDTVEQKVKEIQDNIGDADCYGINFLHNLADPKAEEKFVDLCLKYEIPNVEAAAFMNITPALARLRAKTLAKEGDKVISKVNIMAKISRPEVAELFLRPIPEKMLDKLLSQGIITKEEADMAKHYPVADDITAEADSGGHTDGAVAFALFPSIQSLRDRIVSECGYEKKVLVGLAGGIGTAQAAAAAFIMGADYIVTGSVNQCTIEADTSDLVKDILQDMDVQNTEYAPAGDMFEMGAKVQVAKKGILFAARASKLYELYRQVGSLEEIDAKTRKQIEERYFGRTFEQVYDDCVTYWNKIDPKEIERAEQDPKVKMSLVFKWYFGKSTRSALQGDEKEKVNFQIHCGPALGSFNQWVKGTELESWRNRSVGAIGIKIMSGAEELFENKGIL